MKTFFLIFIYLLSFQNVWLRKYMEMISSLLVLLFNIKLKLKCATNGLNLWNKRYDWYNNNLTVFSAVKLIWFGSKSMKKKKCNCNHNIKIVITIRKKIFLFTIVGIQNDHKPKLAAFWRPVSIFYNNQAWSIPRDWHRSETRDTQKEDTPWNSSNITEQYGTEWLKGGLHQPCRHFFEKIFFFTKRKMFPVQDRDGFSGATTRTSLCSGDGLCCSFFHTKNTVY